MELSEFEKSATVTGYSGVQVGSDKKDLDAPPSLFGENETSSSDSAPSTGQSDFLGKLSKRCRIVLGLLEFETNG